MRERQIRGRAGPSASARRRAITKQTTVTKQTANAYISSSDFFILSPSMPASGPVAWEGVQRPCHR